MSSVDAYTLPPLPYGYDALEPIISKDIMTLHHGMHHATYVKNLNAALSSLSGQIIPARALVPHVNLLQTIKFNAGGHINHTLFWENLSPPGSDSTKPTSAPTLSAALTTRYGSVDKFKTAFQTTLLGIQGSGWGWLVCDAADSKFLDIVTSRDQDTVPANYKPILGIDMWEHAYYLQYRNNKAEYVTKVWEVVNWETMEKRFITGQKDVFGEQLWGLVREGKANM